VSAITDPPRDDANDCGCCEGVSVTTPALVSNRPGLPSIAYRVGTHQQFFESMLAGLSRSSLPAIRGLTTRDRSDFTIAFLDACAALGDVLTFYEERAANETYLRTATERLSIRELARLIDYQLRPGVAASAWLAFTLDDAPGALGQALSLAATAQDTIHRIPPIVIQRGLKVQSVPAPGEQPQTYETVETIGARLEWNALRPRLFRPQPVSASAALVFLRGLENNVKGGDPVAVIDASGQKELKTAARVTLDTEHRTTRVDFSESADVPAATAAALPKGSVSEFAPNTELDDAAVEMIVSRAWTSADLEALAETQGWPLQALTSAIARRIARRDAAADAGVFVFRQRSGTFGHNAPNYDSLPGALRVNTRVRKFKQAGDEVQPDGFTLIPAAFPNSWEENTLAQVAAPESSVVYLSTSVPGVAKGSWMALVSSSGTPQPSISKVLDVTDAAKSAFAISATVTKLSVPTSAPLASFKMRTTVALVQSESLPLDDLPIEDVVSEGGLTLDGPYLGLAVGQRVILTGERSDLAGVTGAETLTLKDVTVEAGFTVITFERAPVYSYVRRTVKLNANVALATQGETVNEILGSGDANQPFQRFTLRQPPLTFVSAPTPSGGETTLEVRVNEVRWHEVPSFFDHGPDERIYITRFDDEGRTTVIFGDGTTGARLPTGPENVRAVYRKGIGLGGLVRADQLTQLMDRPYGVRGVTNPVESSGAADPEQRDDARRNAPLTVLTLGRVVSLKDFESFSRAFSGIEKALATWTWFGEKRGVLLTVAGPKGAAVSDTSDLHRNLVDALRLAGDETVPLLVKSYTSRLFSVAASLAIDPDRLPEHVIEAVTLALRAAFSFEAREFGQPVHLSEVIAVIQAVPGVVFVDVNEFHRADEPVDRLPRIPAAFPRPGGETVAAAELLTLDPRPLQLEVLQ
jgi:predicted phage baseplate assembly protein